MRVWKWVAPGLAAAILTFSGCRSKHVEVIVENRSGGPVRLLEVDYPSASFGRNAMTADETYRYQIQVRGSGKVKVQYTGADGRTVQGEGAELSEGETGRLEIELAPGGKVGYRLEAQPEK
jgi:hypothetical protein